MHHVSTTVFELFINPGECCEHMHINTHRIRTKVRVGARRKKKKGKGSREWGNSMNLEKTIHQEKFLTIV